MKPQNKTIEEAKLIIEDFIAWQLKDIEKKAVLKEGLSEKAKKRKPLKE